MNRLAVLCFLACASLATACGDDANTAAADAAASCDLETRKDTFTAGMNKTGSGGYTVALMDSLPAPPDKGDNTWSLEIADSTGTRDGLDVSVKPFMPDHGHGTPITAVVTPEGSGMYSVTPINLWMPGLWEVTVEIKDQDTVVDQIVFSFCIDG
jgi:hypothetical protein